MPNNCIGKSMLKDFPATHERCCAGCKRKDCSLAAMNFVNRRMAGASVWRRNHQELQLEWTETPHRSLRPQELISTIELTERLSSARQLSYLLVKDPSRLRAKEHQALACIQQEQEIELAYRHDTATSSPDEKQARGYCHCLDQHLLLLW